MQHPQAVSIRDRLQTRRALWQRWPSNADRASHHQRLKGPQALHLRQCAEGFERGGFVFEQGDCIHTSIILEILK
jgi:hypothetical protein